VGSIDLQCDMMSTVRFAWVPKRPAAVTEALGIVCCIRINCIAVTLARFGSLYGRLQYSLYLDSSLSCNSQPCLSDLMKSDSSQGIPEFLTGRSLEISMLVGCRRHLQNRPSDRALERHKTPTASRGRSQTLGPLPGSGVH